MSVKYPDKYYFPYEKKGRKIQIRKTNRVVPESPYLTACKEQDGLLGNIEMNHYTNVGDILFYQRKYRVDPGSNLKMANDDWSEWDGLLDTIVKPGVFDKLVQYFRK